MSVFYDHLGRKVIMPGEARRIVSLCPSITESLFALGLGKKIVGRTRFCIHPQNEVSKVERVGGTKEIKFDRLHALSPDLIIAEKEENTPEMVAELEKHYPVYVVDVEDVEDAIKMLLDLGTLTGTADRAKAITGEIIAARKEINPSANKPKVAYFIWKDPYMGVGRDTYIDAVMEDLGWKNVLLPLEGRYPKIGLKQIGELEVDLVLLSSEPYPFQEKHLQEFRSIFPSSIVQLVDGEMFSWYGSRMVQAYPYLKRLNQDLCEKLKKAKLE